MSKKSIFKLFFAMNLVALLASCSDGRMLEKNETPDESRNISASEYTDIGEVYNPEAVIPPQCYTKTDGNRNPCYACHQTYSKSEGRPNIMSDGGLQGNYEFSDEGIKNSWKNLFADRREYIENVSDSDIKNWVLTDNYSEFITRLESNQDWEGEIAKIKNLAYPDEAFYENGLAKDGSHWVAFNYKPFPSTFWPTNGSTGDVMVRLPAAFREVNGVYNSSVYFANLALLEMAIKDVNKVSTSAISEVALSEDIDGDGTLKNNVNTIAIRDTYLGDASNIQLAKMLYPEGTEFLHTVRYIGVDEKGQIFNAPRMKEVRYMRKAQFKHKNLLSTSYYREAKEKDFGKLPVTVYTGDKGISNGFGWVINGYIEDKDGSLRQQHREELAFCNGCHKTVGTTFDQTFSFARKVEGKKGWGYIDLKTQKDVPNYGERKGEFLTYMQRVGGGDEFRQNKEMLQLWFNSDGTVNREKVEATKSLYELIMPSAERALALNKAYKAIVDEQSYIFGRDAVLAPARNVLQHVDDSVAPLQESHRHHWDMRLDWSGQRDLAESL